MRTAWSGLLVMAVLAACGSSSPGGAGNDGGATDSGGANDGNGANGCEAAGGHCACSCDSGEMADPRLFNSCPQGPPGSGVCGLQCCLLVDAGAACTGTPLNCFCGSLVCTNGQWTCTSCVTDAAPHD